MNRTSRVVFMCGPSGAGKTTYARRLEADGLVRLSFDAGIWARGITSGEVPEAVREEIRAELREELLRLVSEGRDVVLDFPFWSRAMREEWRAPLAPLGIVPETVYLATDRDTVLERVRARTGDHADDFPVDLEVAAAYVDRFEPPVPEEGPLLVVVDREEFAVTRRRAGVYDYDWVNHRHGGHGFSSATNERRRRTVAATPRPSGSSSPPSTRRPASSRTTRTRPRTSPRPARAGGTPRRRCPRA